MRLSRSHDQNRCRAGETAGKAATLAVQCARRRNRRILLTDTEDMENRADELPLERERGKKVFLFSGD